MKQYLRYFWIGLKECKLWRWVLLAAYTAAPSYFHFDITLALCWICAPAVALLIAGIIRIGMLTERERNEQ